MYGQQFVSNQVYGQPGMMSYPSGMLQPQVASNMSGTMIPNYYSRQMYHGAFQQSMSASLMTPSKQSFPTQPMQQSQQNSTHSSRSMRGRNNEIGDISSVIHMRNVTPEVTQLSIQNFAANFGNIKHIVMLRQMNQALVEMESKKSAQQLVDFFKDPGYVEVDGRRVYIRYSNHQSLTSTQQISRTLLVSMFNTHYDVSSAAQITPEIVYQIFSSYGTVQRIVVLPKNESSQWNYNRIQALVQFDNRESAEHVKNILQGQPVTLADTITFMLDIQFSRMDEIKTTNPMTSIVVDENGIAQRPLLQQTSSQTSNVAGRAGGIYVGSPAQQWN
ncbi:unnamed protein product [Phytomonas sp. Hart1]|nr:unnamed protein product [Phytomonas sp. Hart1]|eukprot:CCW67518.1 unnamed protein product [Phytomonas sp. isolate Hart1]